MDIAKAPVADRDPDRRVVVMYVQYLRPAENPERSIRELLRATERTEHVPNVRGGALHALPDDFAVGLDPREDVCGPHCSLQGSNL